MNFLNQPLLTSRSSSDPATDSSSSRRCPSPSMHCTTTVLSSLSAAFRCLLIQAGVLGYYWWMSLTCLSIWPREFAECLGSSSCVRGVECGTLKDFSTMMAVFSLSGSNRPFISSSCSAGASSYLQTLSTSLSLWCPLTSTARRACNEHSIYSIRSKGYIC